MFHLQSRARLLRRPGMETGTVMSTPLTSASSPVTLIESAAAELRLDAARAFVERHMRAGDVLIVGASRGAADDFARTIASRRGATLGLHRFSLTQLAA